VFMHTYVESESTGKQRLFWHNLWDFCSDYCYCFISEGSSSSQIIVSTQKGLSHPIILLAVLSKLHFFCTFTCYRNSCIILIHDLFMFWFVLKIISLFLSQFSGIVLPFRQSVEDCCLHQCLLVCCNTLLLIPCASTFSVMFLSTKVQQQWKTYCSHKTIVNPSKDCAYNYPIMESHDQCALIH